MTTQPTDSQSAFPVPDAHAQINGGPDDPVRKITADCRCGGKFAITDVRSKALAALLDWNGRHQHGERLEDVLRPALEDLEGAR